MPAKNKIKVYQDQGFYHLYNRGVEKRLIFVDSQDTSVFLNYLKEYLTPKDVTGLTEILQNPSTSQEQKAKALKLLRMNNFALEIDLLCYCLMPNHIHLLIKQHAARSIEQFMRSLCTRYVQYFNKKYHRVGTLFQDTYKAVLIQANEQLLQVSRYIHRNPASKGLTLKECPQPSSYKNYLGEIHQSWIKPEEILSFFTKSGFLSYSSFIEDPLYDEQMLVLTNNLLIDDDEEL